VEPLLAHPRQSASAAVGRARPVDVVACRRRGLEARSTDARRGRRGYCRGGGDSATRTVQQRLAARATPGLRRGRVDRTRRSRVLIDHVFKPTVDRRAEPAGHRARIRLGTLNGDPKPPPTTTPIERCLRTSATSPARFRHSRTTAKSPSWPSEEEMQPTHLGGTAEPGTVQSAVAPRRGPCRRGRAGG
jgi:hypothetical protein